MLAVKLKSLFGVAEEADDWRERRAEPRSKVLLKGDAYPVEGYADLVVTNLSRTGLSGETDAPLDVDQSLLFSVAGNRFHMGTVRWVKGRRFGLDMEDALAILGPANDVDPGFLPTHQPRARRHDVELYGRIAIAPCSVRATIRDISQSGLCIDMPAPLVERQQVIVRLRDRPLILASVQWTGGGRAGIRAAERMETLRLVYAYE
ncbi:MULTISPECIES: PilZ domain-containing protein [Sphingomonas]|nr:MULTISPECIES: PilZ domain-containing protein [Sphingomonas]MBA2921133.1 PilZ domain-containing protein [Sphingomonas sp. CGMCC 1.13658]